MVQFAECQSVRHHRFALWVTVREDVRRFQKFGVAEAADGAMPAIRGKNSLTESLLMQSVLHFACDVAPSTDGLLAGGVD